MNLTKPGTGMSFLATLLFTVAAASAQCPCNNSPLGDAAAVAIHTRPANPWPGKRCIPKCGRFWPTRHAQLR